MTSTGAPTWYVDGEERRPDSLLARSRRTTELTLVVMAALITFVPLVVNLTTGLGSVEPASEEVLRSVAATRGDVFRKLRVPHALPYLFAALRVCVGLALIGALVAEWFGSTEGLGRTMTQARNSLAITELWAAVAVLMLMGIVGTAAVRVVERRALRWHVEAGAAGR